MPELPDLTIYLEAIDARTRGARCTGVTVVNPFVLRSVDPPPSALVGGRLTGTRRVGKRLVFEFGDDLRAVIHLMVAGRLQWSAKPPKPNRRTTHALFAFETGTLAFTEAGTQKRASLHVVRGDDAVDAFARGGIEPLGLDARTFAERLRLENHTLKRTLTDPRLFSGIGNAYSDEILHRARLSPLLLTSRITDEEAARLHAATQEILVAATARLRDELQGAWPAKVTAFRDDFAAHGKFRQPCPVCATPIQRIRYASNETNYCPQCQTGGRLLADRALSRLLKEDWPRSLEEMEEKLGVRC